MTLRPAATPFGPTGVLARTTAARTLLYTADYQGNVSQQIDASSGSIVASYAFDSFGGRLVSSSDPAATSDPYSGYGGTMGYFTDWETGLQLLGHRFYDSTAGRFLNRDPMDTGGGINVYGYVSNNPLDMSDPSGFGDDEGGRGGGHGGGGAGGGGLGGGGHMGWGKPPTVPGLPARIGGGFLGCGLAMATTLLAALMNEGMDTFHDQALLCPLFTGCAIGAICGVLGVMVGGAWLGCAVGAFCGATSAAVGQLCADFNIGCPGTEPPSNKNNWCQLISGAVTGCIGGMCGPLCGTLLSSARYGDGSSGNSY